ncbi:hypothetical protein B484DRAFT_410185 [Ochromonadaceae sp. CCMP2298]|nr:hypothetical protein B484DRAFT_410185 [Ochromonadaceae sp. CCMP2298]
MSTPRRGSLPTAKRQPVSGGWKKAANAVSRARTARVSFGNAEEKDEVIAKLGRCRAQGARIGSDVVVGYNGVMRLVERGQAAVVCVARDIPPALLIGLADAAAACAVPCLSFPRLSVSLRIVLGLRSASCFALRLLHLPATPAITLHNTANMDGKASSGGADTVARAVLGADKGEGAATDAAGTDAQEATVVAADAAAAAVDDLRDHLLALVHAPQKDSY